MGASVVIVKDGHIIAQKGYGYSDKSGQKAVDPASTVFRIASVSKTFTAVAIMQLIEQGKIDLKEDFSKYVSNLKFDNPFQTPVTIEHLLTHTTGFEIRDPQPEDIHQDFNKFVEIEDYVRDHMPPVKRQPGTSYMYDNFGYLLLGLIVQNVSGELFQNYMDRHVFQPLGMKSSGFLLDGHLKDNLATGYDATNMPLDLYTVTPTIMPHGGMLSTAEDVGKFMTAFLNGGANLSGRILTKNSVDMMEQYRSFIHPLLPDTTYGFEAPFQLPGAGSNPHIITKGGDLNGFSSYLFLIPEQNTGVFLTYNKLGGLRNQFYPQFISTFFPKYAAPVELEDYNPQSLQDPDKFRGLYADLRLNVFVTSIDTNLNGLLKISNTVLGPRTLRQVNDNLFVDNITNQFTAFKQDGNGKTIYMKEPYINPFGYSRKGDTAVGFSDVNEKHPYAKYILGLQSLGYYPNNAKEAFMPEKTVTRAEFVQNILQISNIKGSKTKELAFSDIKGHPAASFIQMAYELGMVTGYGHGQFEPDRVITLQEYAVMLWRLLKNQYPSELFDDVKLSGETDEWAVQAVQMMFALGLHGPEVKPQPDGAVDFHSMKPMTQQEEAAVWYAMLTQPTNHIVAAKEAARKR